MVWHGERDRISGVGRAEESGTNTGWKKDTEGNISKFVNIIFID